MTPRAGFSTRADDAHGLVYSARGNVLPGGMNAQTTFNSEIIVDNFAGGGGASTGMELAFGRGDTERMEAEAVQVAAVALAILEQSGVALRVTEQVAKALGRVPDKPKCFYGDSDLCKGMTVNNDDEPIEACKRCRWCSAGYQQLEAEAAEKEVTK